MAVERKRTTTTTVDATPAEWRWVITASAVLLVLISLPLIWALWVDMTTPDQMFMGILSNPLDGATYLSKIQLGKEGYWRTFFRHSPDADQGAYVTLLYNALGQFSRYLSLSNTFTYHAGRLVGALLMFLAIYQLASIIWRRQRTRRMFFLLAVIGSGFGWFFVLFGIETSDLVIPEAFPLYGAATNVQFPVALALLCIAVGEIVMVFRPGFREDPTVQNGGMTLLMCSLGLAVVAPHALVPFGLALGLLIAFDSVQQRKIQGYQMRWFLILLLPAVPVAVYYMAEIRYNADVATWMGQNLTPSPVLPVFLAGLGLPLLVALPGIWRAVRRFEADGDQFMLLWLVCILLVIYLPTNAQRRFAIGIMLPVAYFAVRALTDFWLDDRSETYRGRFMAVVYGVSSISYIFLMLIWWRAASSTTNPLFYLHADYAPAFTWLRDEVEHDTVVLSSPEVGLWLPGQTGMSVVYGHPYETFDAETHHEIVDEWFAAEDSDAAVCERVLRQYDVRYVLVGPAERGDDATSPACTADLTEVQQFGDVVLYEP